MSRRWIALAIALLAGHATAARADAVSDFYKGKTVQLVLGYGPGGGYDVYARTIARFLGHYIPGSPNVVVVNMPGAGSLRATNYLYTTAPKDGTVIGAFARDMPLMGILGGNSNVQFDPRKFTWIGSASSATDDAYLLYARKDAPVKTIEEARKPGGPKLTIGGTAAGQPNRINSSARAGVFATGFCTGSSVIKTSFSKTPVPYNIGSSRNLRIVQ